ncbi:MAG: primosomal protein N' [Deltaproteobacteria bacterium GWA2_38_16]|nr:MAG: primosomal protein N' [Deltaproteobacteria bacterium GWA2_38_16]OGQ01738.1 MAG: primosomal protein N' [Deltaproteobacteria bacterium RIFCSPHIGHO2_02_FULL_38_15]OGQ33419.1 MAG: primosomal protein N' [Deltaproteobacteria bacterium RIFCSPLOWO2_01_FULL_38_9]OGQ62234.1 MAG: primosomal protein N' [Deltaproteobacteria bacterium RIFCSPLOWO2_12_FULL_38_8]HBQ21459.1 primosomal protein N' [Deltaproteobacteria bacterium]
MITRDLVEVAVPLPLFKTFHYKIPSHLKNNIQEGSQVLVPFKNKKLLGFVVGFPQEKVFKTKEILEISHPQPLFSNHMLEFLKWISSYYATPLGEVLKSALPFSSTSQKSRVKEYVFSPWSLPSKNPISLTPAQITALHTLQKALQAQTFSSFLLHGVTGSGKTEIYLRLIKEALLLQKKAIVLVPEISLTPQLISRFEAHFPGKLALLHSRLTPAQRQKEWFKIKNNIASIAIGARSAIFAPFENMGVIIVDEEHDASFKQEEKFRYNAKDLALVRGQFEKAIVVLGSATPSIESYFNSEHQKIIKLELPSRIEGQVLPPIDIVDLKSCEGNFGQDFIFSKPLLYALEETLSQKSQAILLLNRRGWASFLLCQECGYIAKCSHCSVSLTFYAKTKKLICHYCGHTLSFSSACPDCQSASLSPIGLGTEKVEEELKKYFPKASIARLDRSSTQKKDTLENILSQFSKQKIDILIGTQMIAKGHDFPNVTLSAVILADISLHIPDFRAPERTFQLLTQVAGRAGRGEKGGKVIIQTFHPNHYSIQCAKTHDYANFYKTELSYRQELQYPPFSRLIHFKISSAIEKKALEKIKELAALCRHIQSSHSQFLPLEFLGPAPSPLSKLKDKYRFHMLMKSPSHQHTRLFLKNLLQEEKFLRDSPAIQIDVDPLNLL